MSPDISVNADIFSGTQIKEIDTAKELSEILSGLDSYAFVPVFNGSTLSSAAFAHEKTAYFTSYKIFLQSLYRQSSLHWKMRM